MSRTRLAVWLALLTALGCARGGDPEDAGAPGMDAALADAGVEDAGGGDAGERDAGDDAGEALDGGHDAGGGGATACTAASAPEVCGGRPCVDGYCCDQPCDGACRGCAVPGAEGTCTPYAAGTDPGDECATQAPATCGTSGACDGDGACARYAAGTGCDDGQACTTDDACDGAGTCRGAAPPDCNPAPGNECCLGSCDASGGCRTEAGTCADVCGGSSLSVGRSCQGCGAARAAGSCLGGAIHRCDAASHSPCQEVSCGGVAYFCTNLGGTWAWRAAAICDDADPCTHTDLCVAGACRGSAVSCASTDCMTRACNGTASCTETPRTGTSCDDGNPCTYGDACSAAGVCAAGGTATCTSTACLMRSCNGTATCTETPRTGLACDDANPCTHGETCGAGGACGGGAPVVCPPDTPCRVHACNGTSTCTATARNVGGACDDGDPGTPIDRCAADGTCVGSTCSPTLLSVFADDFTAPSSSSWTSGADAAITTSRWRAFTTSQHGARIDGGRLELTNQRGSSGPGHGQGYAYVRTGGAGSAYDNTRYASTLGSNVGHEVVWSLNMRRDDPESTDGGFSCSSSSSQNGITVGLAYVLAASSASGLNASADTCSASATSFGYAVVMGGSGGRVRLVRFVNGLRNGTLTTIAQSSAFTRSHHLSVRVTYDADTHGWRLEVRSDGSSTFANPATGTYTSTTTGTDATYVGMPLDFAGPYFQSGCCCLCSSRFTARFDNVSVGVRCAGG
ncbi:MAG: hypothetical protein KF729_28205 [Sandaracinaceae bacterium]|nr:hypothetical protein [Sandaracinaceae bacterium]